MLTNDTMRKLNELKLFGMARGFENQLSSAAAAHLAFEERLGLLVDQEVTYRENRRLKRMYADLSMQADLLKEALGKK